MTKNEEEKLLRDADLTDRESKGVRQAQLNEAVRQGIRQGKKRSAQRRAVYGTGAATAVAAGLIALSSSFMPGAGNPTAAPAPHTVNAAPAQVPGDSQKPAAFEKMKDYMGIGMSTLYVNAIQNGAMSSVNETIEKDGYTLTLRGEAMDNRRMLLAYSLKNDTDQPARFNGTNVDFGADMPTKWVSTDMGASPSVPSGGRGTYFSEIELSPGTDYPESATFVTTIVPGEFGEPTGAETRLELPFTAHPQVLKSQIETVETEQDLAISGQRIDIDRLEISPLGIYLDYTPDAANDKRILGVIEPKLTLKNEAADQIGNPRFTGKKHDKNTLIFESSKLENKDSIVLSVAGISAIDPQNGRIVIDTETGKILEGGEGMTAAVDREKDTLTLQNTLGEYNTFNLENAIQLSFEDTFTDGDGVKHKLDSVSGAREDKGGKMVETHVLKLEDKGIVQPVTLNVRDYWSPIMESQDVQIK